jgi:hypothetical protein
MTRTTLMSAAAALLASTAAAAPTPGATTISLQHVPMTKERFTAAAERRSAYMGASIKQRMAAFYGANESSLPIIPMLNVADYE